MNIFIHALLDQTAPRFQFALLPLIQDIGRFGISFTFESPGLPRGSAKHPGWTFLEWGVEGCLEFWLSASESQRVLAIPEMRCIDIHNKELHIALQQSRTVVVYSREMETSLLNYDASIAEKVSLIELIPHLDFTPSALPTMYHFVSVGPLVWQSGFEFAIDAIGMAVQENTHITYTIVGDGEYLDALIYAARQWKIWNTSHFSICSLSDNDNLLEILTRAQALIEPSVEATDGLIVRLAYALGIPVIAIPRDARALKSALLSMPSPIAKPITTNETLPVMKFKQLFQSAS